MARLTYVAGYIFGERPLITTNGRAYFRQMAPYMGPTHYQTKEKVGVPPSRHGDNIRPNYSLYG